MKYDIFHDEENLEFLYDFKEARELLKELKEYIEICEEKILYSSAQPFSYEGVMRLWARHAIKIAKEQYNNFETGNFFSVAAMNRTVIECFVFIACLQEYRDEEVWKD